MLACVFLFLRTSTLPSFLDMICPYSRTCRWCLDEATSPNTPFEKAITCLITWSNHNILTSITCNLSYVMLLFQIALRAYNSLPELLAYHCSSDLSRDIASLLFVQTSEYTKMNLFRT